MIDPARYSFIPVVTIRELADTVPTLSALCEGGLPVAEITFRTACAEEAIRLGSKTFPDMLIGAGTVINEEQCLRALDAGARFIVSPGLGKEIAAVCAERGVPYYPGCVTPTEIMEALRLGLTVLKFFPAGIYGGLKALKALSAPFPQVEFIPTGGIDASNLNDYLAFDRVKAVGGTYLLKGDVKANTEALMKQIACIRS